MSRQWQTESKKSLLMKLQQILLLPSSTVYQHCSNSTPCLGAHVPPMRAYHTYPQFCVTKTLPGCCQHNSHVVSDTLNWKNPHKAIHFIAMKTLWRDQVLCSFGWGRDFKQMWMRTSLCHLTFGPGISPWRSFTWHECLEFEVSFCNLEHFQRWQAVTSSSLGGLVK